MLRLDDLQMNGLKLYQDSDYFCFGTDAVLLANFARVKRDGLVCDLGSGNGIIPLIMSQRTKASKIYGIEIQKEQAELFSKSVMLNSLSDRIFPVLGDMRQVDKLFDRASFDCVVSNPPYKEVGGGIKNLSGSMTISRHEIHCGIEDVFRAADYLLKPAGNFYMIHRPERLCDIMMFARQFKIEPKRIRLVLPKSESRPSMVLFEGKKGANPKLIMEKPLVLLNKDGSETDELKAIYGRN